MTARVRLRALARSDLALFRALYCNADTMRHIGRPLARSLAPSSLHATVAAAGKATGPRFFVILEQGGARPAGLCSIRHTVDAARREIGIMLVRAARGRGLAGEAFHVLIDAAFRKLPITAVSVQYRSANVAVSRVCDRLGFAPAGLPRAGAKAGPRVRILQRSQWQRRFQPPPEGKAMSNIIAFLEQAGRDAALRHMTREQLLRRMGEQNIAPKLQDALMQPESSALAALLGARETMYCLNQRIDAPKKAPAKAPKKAPKKAPAKAPAKKPAKKAPVKRKR